MRLLRYDETSPGWDPGYAEAPQAIVAFTESEE
jgi:hypothetical protein